MAWCLVGVGGLGRALVACLVVWVLFNVLVLAGVVGGSSGLLPGWRGWLWPDAAAGYLTQVVLEVAIWLSLFRGMSSCGLLCGGLLLAVACPPRCQIAVGVVCGVVYG